MTASKDKNLTIWEQFLKPIFELVIDREELKQLHEQIDWEKGSDRFKSPNLIYPNYYVNCNFHGIDKGYLNPEAAVTYDPVTQYALPPNETWIREGLIEAIGGQPRRILDLGCGTGSTTLILKQKFPDAEVIGLDLSPYMLVMADYKATKENIDIKWIHAKAEATGFPDAQFDLVTASLLFHETPVLVSEAILKECFRLLVPGGQAIVLDGNQKTIRHTEWLTKIFEEPYIDRYASGSVDAWMGAAGFFEVKTEELWMINQVTRGLKPISVSKNHLVNDNAIDLDGNEEIFVPGF
jgi:ubiquinone/menaquinone biosynthesis C-methylase UbiE